MPPLSDAQTVTAPPTGAAALGLAPADYHAICTKSDTAWSALVDTPCYWSEVLATEAGCPIALKFENQQVTGSFKERGALAKLLSLTEDERSRGVIAASAGNHAQGVARHASLMGVNATIVMPAHTPRVKVEKTKSLGAAVILSGEDFDAAHHAALEEARITGATYIHPFDDPFVCAGQGTTGLELINAAPEVDTLVIPIGGGGLIAGVAAAVKDLRPDIQVIGVQSSVYPGMVNALRGAPRRCTGNTLAEGIAVSQPGHLTRTIVRELVDEILLIEEDDLERALCLLLTEQKTLAEGAGAAGLAAVLAHPAKFKGRRVGTIICGGNIDTRLLSSILMRDLARRKRLARLRIELIDVPGQLTLVSEAIASAGGNVIDISYHRVFNDLPAKSTYLDISVEASDSVQMDNIVESVRRAGPPVTLLTTNQA